MEGGGAGELLREPAAAACRRLKAEVRVRLGGGR